MTRQSSVCVSAAICALALVTHAGAQAAHWSNLGGNAQRSGLSTQIGPDASADILWQNGPSSIIAWPPLLEGDTLAVVRQTTFPPGTEPNGSTIHLLDIDTGASSGTINLPFSSGQWTTWIAGIKNGRLFASRSGNGATVSAPIRAYDVATRQFLWASQASQNAGPYDGVVFADDGDLIVGSLAAIWRIDWNTGQTVWTSPRVCSVSSSCGGALSVTGDALYIVDAVAGGHAVRKFRLSDGQFLYRGPTMTGFTLQNTPLVSPDGTIIIARTQNNPVTDFLYAFDDTGTAITQRWAIPCGWTTFSSFAVGPGPAHDVYAFGTGTPQGGFPVIRVSAANGAIVNSSAPIIADFLQPQMAIDARGVVYVSNGAFSNGRLFSFNPDLTPRWNFAITNANIGGPTLGKDGTLVMAGNGTQLFAWRTARGLTCDDVDFNNDGIEQDPTDLEAFLSVYSGGPCIPSVATCNDVDFNNDAIQQDPTDIESFLSVYSGGPCL